MEIFWLVNSAPEAAAEISVIHSLGGEGGEGDRDPHLSLGEHSAQSAPLLQATSAHCWIDLLQHPTDRKSDTVAQYNLRIQVLN